MFTFPKARSNKLIIFLNIMVLYIFSALSTSPVFCQSLTSANIDDGSSDSTSEIIYVNSNATRTPDGKSWDTAYKSIQEAINKAVNDHQVSIWVAQGAYKENIVLKDKDGIRLYGSFKGTETSLAERDPNLTSIDGNRAGSVIVLINANNILIDGFTITNGTGFTVDQESFGGGILLFNSSLTVTNSKIAENKAKQGGGIYCFTSSAQVYNNQILNNQAEHGGGIFCQNSSLITIANNTISENTATGGNGGGIFCADSSPQIRKNDIINNYAESGGGITCSGPGIPIITENTIAENTASVNGGGIMCNESSPQISWNLIKGNRVKQSGGGIYSQYSSFSAITHNKICDNLATTWGGGISCQNSSPFIIKNDIINNKAYEGGGGGITCIDSSSFIITKNIIRKNTTNKWGGGIACISSSPQITENQFDNNKADEGQDIACFSSSVPKILNNNLVDDRIWFDGTYLSCDLENPLSKLENPWGKLYGIHPIEDTSGLPNNNLIDDYIWFDEISSSCDLEKSYGLENLLDKRYGIHSNEDTSGLSVDLFIAGQYAYLANWDSGLKIINISDPDNPIECGSLKIPQIMDIDLVEDYAYVVDQISGLKIIDIKDVDDPKLLAELPTLGTANGVRVAGNYAYIADGENGFCLVDITQKDHPFIKSNINTQGFAYQVYVAAGLAYIADGEAGLQVIDCSNDNPSILRSIDTDGLALDVCVSDDGNYAYIADGERGLQVINCSDPNNPLRGYCDTPGYAQSVQIFGSWAYVADGMSGIQIIDVSDPNSPHVIHSINPPYSTKKVFIEGDHIFAADLSGMYTLPIPSPPTTPAEWTLMIYLNADNDLDRYGIEDINEMERANSWIDPNLMNIIVLVDRINNIATSIDDKSNDNWTTTRIYEIKHDHDPSNINSPLIQDMGELDMGDPHNLTHFIRWGMDNYPATKYGLVIWNHGSGLDANFVGPVRLSEEKVKEIYSDKTSERVLYNKDIAAALSSIKEDRQMIDILGFDSCLMGMIEVAYELKDSANYLVFSEEKEPSQGWPYDIIIEKLAEDPRMSAKTLSQRIVESYQQYYSKQCDSAPTSDSLIKRYTLTSIDLSKVKVLGKAVDELALAIIDSNDSSEYDVIKEAKKRCCKISYNLKREHIYIDLYHFVHLLTSNLAISSRVKEAANRIKELIDPGDQNSIIVERCLGPEVIPSGSGEGLHGLAIYFPENIKDYMEDIEYNRVTISFPGYTRWGKFLEWYYKIKGIDAYDIQFISDPNCSDNAYCSQFIGGGERLDIDLSKENLIPLPFPFTFYGKEYNFAYFSNYGFLFFKDDDSEKGPTIKCEIMSESFLNKENTKIIAPLFTCLFYNPKQKEEGIYVHKPTSDSVCFRWEAEEPTYAPDDQMGSVNFEVILFQDGRIQFNYGLVNKNIPPAIGISKGDNVNYYKLSYQQSLGFLNTGQSLLFTPVKSYAWDGNCVIVNTPGSAWNVYKHSDYAYVADDIAGVQIYDVSNPKDPQRVERIETPGTVYDVAISDYLANTYAYIIWQSSEDIQKSGLDIVDISDKKYPKHLDTILLDYGMPKSIYLTSYSSIYLAYDSGILQEIEIDMSDSSNPLRPKESIQVGSTGDWVVDVFTQGNYTYVTNGRGVEILKKDSLGSLKKIGSLKTSGTAKAVYVRGNHGYIAGGEEGLQIINLSIPDSSYFVSSFDTPGLASGVFVNDNYAYIADGPEGLCIVNISDPNNPVFERTYKTEGINAHDVVVSDGYAYVAGRDSGLWIIKVPTSPCIDNTQCITGEYCKKEKGDCYGQGVCSDRMDQEMCPDILNPVYGCDGRMYSNACHAAVNGASIDKCGCNGDVSNDGTITPQDAFLAFKCYLGLDSCPSCSDVNCDGEVTPYDALCIFQKYLGLPSCLD